MLHLRRTFVVTCWRYYYYYYYYYYYSSSQNGRMKAPKTPKIASECREHMGKLWQGMGNPSFEPNSCLVSAPRMVFPIGL